MPPVRKSFRRFTLTEYIDFLRPFVGRVVFDKIHVHGTWKPTIAQFRKDGGLKLVQSMWRFHTGQGWGDIGQHATIDPDGYIWEGRSLLTMPCSATGYNGSNPVHPFMFEMIGNFDKGCELLAGPQLATAAGLCRAIMQLWNRGPDMIHLHREMTNQKTCPGSGIDKGWFLEQVKTVKVEPPKEAKPKMSEEDAEKIIRFLQAAYNATEDKEARAEYKRLANEVRKAAGIPVT